MDGLAFYSCRSHLREPASAGPDQEGAFDQRDCHLARGLGPVSAAIQLESVSLAFGLRLFEGDLPFLVFVDACPMRPWTRLLLLWAR